MPHTPHELAEEFPQHIDRIHALKDSDPHFARLVHDYHAVNRAVHRAETLVEPTSSENEHAMRSKRMHLKDQIWAILQKSGA